MFIDIMWKQLVVSTQFNLLKLYLNGNQNDVEPTNDKYQIFGRQKKFWR